jgi:amyloid beta precursor protein binding protein 1
MATNDKYDRQLRLWGSNGQRALMNAHILLINADAVGTETLKNLVLPGIGKFTVMDNKKVTERDLGNNFFVENSELGKSRAEVVTKMLCEMNADVTGTAISSYPINQEDSGLHADFWSQFTLVIASNMAESQLLELSSSCYINNIPLMIVRSYGFIGYCRILLQNHHIVESKPDSDPYDLRILNPFKELEEYCAGFNLAEMESLEHGHTPYIVILYQAIQKWRSTNDGVLPSNYKAKELFKQSIKEMARDFNMELNYEEAVKEAYKVFTTKGIYEYILIMIYKYHIVFAAESL